MIRSVTLDSSIAWEATGFGVLGHKRGKRGKVQWRV